MPPKSFPDFMVYKLVKEVKERPCIWNTELEIYNDRFHLAIAWNQIAEKLKMPDDLLRLKWKNIRDTFKRELKKYNCKTVDDYNGRWQFFRAVGFVHKPGESLENEAESDKEQSEQTSEAETETVVKIEAIEESVTQEPVVQYLEQFQEVEVCPISEKRRRVSTDDEYDLMFLKSLAPYFRDLDPIKKLTLRIKIQDILLNEIAAQTSSSKTMNNKKT